MQRKLAQEALYHPENCRSESQGNLTLADEYSYDGFNEGLRNYTKKYRENPQQLSRAIDAFLSEILSQAKDAQRR